jgi:hypothetical protein
MTKNHASVLREKTFLLINALTMFAQKTLPAPAEQTNVPMTKPPRALLVFHQPLFLLLLALMELATPATM